MNFYQKPGSSNLAENWKWAWHLNLFSMTKVKTLNAQFSRLNPAKINESTKKGGRVGRKEKNGKNKHKILHKFESIGL